MFLKFYFICTLSGTAIRVQSSDEKLPYDIDHLKSDLAPAAAVAAPPAAESFGVNGATLTTSQWSPEPYFDESTSRNVTALIGKSAYLSCRVKCLGNKTVSCKTYAKHKTASMYDDGLQVSFVRHRDLHILTVGRYTYTTDQRFIATHRREADEWALQIKWTQLRDAGVKCVIN